jgi:hypothetical protein
VRTADGEVRMRAASKHQTSMIGLSGGTVYYVIMFRRKTTASCLLIPMQTTSFKPLGMPWMTYSCMDGELDSVTLPSDR